MKFTRHYLKVPLKGITARPFPQNQSPFDHLRLKTCQIIASNCESFCKILYQVSDYKNFDNLTQALEVKSLAMIQF